LVTRRYSLQTFAKVNARVGRTIPDRELPTASVLVYASLTLVPCPSAPSLSSTMTWILFRSWRFVRHVRKRCPPWIRASPLRMAQSGGFRGYFSAMCSPVIPRTPMTLRSVRMSNELNRHLGSIKRASGAPRSPALFPFPDPSCGPKAVYPEIGARRKKIPPEPGGSVGFYVFSLFGDCNELTS
jgi:hypothetical protein